MQLDMVNYIVGTIFLAEVPTGVIADRIGRKWSVVTALLLQTLGEVEKHSMFAMVLALYTNLYDSGG